MQTHTSNRTRRISATAPLLDAKQAARLLGVPHTWLLAQARARTIPHHRLGHYVRFDPDDLADWLDHNKLSPERTLAARRP